jgi:hypothetical protein
MPARELDRLQSLTERRHGSRLGNLQKSRPGQDLVNVVLEPRQPIVDVIATHVPEKVRPGPAVDPKFIKSAVPNPIAIK